MDEERLDRLILQPPLRDCWQVHQALDACGPGELRLLEQWLAEGRVRGDWRRAAVRRRIEAIGKGNRRGAEGAEAAEWESHIPCDSCHTKCPGPCARYDAWLAANPARSRQPAQKPEITDTEWVS